MKLRVYAPLPVFAFAEESICWIQAQSADCFGVNPNLYLSLQNSVVAM